VLSLHPRLHYSKFVKNSQEISSGCESSRDLELRLNWWRIERSMGTVPRSYFRSSVSEQVAEAAEVERWRRCADAIGVMNGDAHYPELDDSSQLLEARQVLGIISAGGTIAYKDSDALRAEIKN